MNAPKTPLTAHSYNQAQYLDTILETSIKTPLISVLLPVYNVENYIVESLNSIINQTITDFEILIIDDCSTDKTLQKIATFTDSRIRLIQKPQNKGLIDSLNLGMQLAKGTYIARMDGDDISTTDRLEKQILVLLKNPKIKAVGCWLQMFGISNKITKHKQFHDEIMVELISHCAMSLGSVIFEKQWASSFPFRENAKHYEDYDFWSRAAWTGQLYNVQEVLYYYRAHQNQVSSLYNKMQKIGDIEVRINLLKKLQYDSSAFKNDVLTTVMLQNKYYEPQDFKTFLNWISFLKKSNQTKKIYDIAAFNNKLNQIKRAIVFNLFFTSNIAKIDKAWRKKVLVLLDINDFWYVVKLKSREVLKKLSR